MTRHTDRRSWWPFGKTIILIFLTTLIGAWSNSLVAQDKIQVSAEKDAEINNQTGVLTLRQNVIVFKESTGTRIRADRLNLRRDATTDALLYADAAGNVEVIYKEESRGNDGDILLYCESAILDREIDQLDVQGSVLLRSDSYRLDAERVIYDFRKKQGKISAATGKRVHLTFKKTDQEGRKKNVRARAEEIHLFENQKKIVLQGNVEVEDAIDGSVFESDHADMFFRQDDEIETMIATGDFVLEQPGRHSRSDRAVFDFTTEEVTLTGNANVKVDNEIEIDSSQIVMFMQVERGVIRSNNDAPVRMTIPIDK